MINRQVGSWKHGGGMHIPQNGSALSIADDTLPTDSREKIVRDAWVEYVFASDDRPIVAGIQAVGSLLLITVDGCDPAASTEADSTVATLP